MLSFALIAVATFDGERFVRLDPQADARYWELQPISERFESEALAVNGLDRERLRREGLTPAEAMHDADRWVRQVAGERQAVLVAYPVAFDWPFLQWYFSLFLGTSPFGHGTCVDIRSLYIGAAGSTYALSSAEHLPPDLRPGREHTHNALEDAAEQGELFCNIFEWALRRCPSLHPS